MLTYVYIHIHMYMNAYTAIVQIHWLVGKFLVILEYRKPLYSIVHHTSSKSTVSCCAQGTVRDLSI